MEPINSLYDLLNDSNWEPSEKEIEEMAFEYNMRECEMREYAANSYDNDAQFYGETI
jgi:hypothetical protein